MSDDAQWLPQWPPFKPARQTSADGEKSAFRRLWLLDETGIEALELWVDPATVVAVGVQKRAHLMRYGSSDTPYETSVVYVGRLNPRSFVVLGSPSQVFSLLEIRPEGDSE